jgi:hypothetical protein
MSNIFGRRHAGFEEAAQGRPIDKTIVPVSSLPPSLTNDDVTVKRMLSLEGEISLSDRVRDQLLERLGVQQLIDDAVSVPIGTSFPDDPSDGDLFDLKVYRNGMWEPGGEDSVANWSSFLSSGSGGSISRSLGNQKYGSYGIRHTVTSLSTNADALTYTGATETGLTVGQKLYGRAYVRVASAAGPVTALYIQARYLDSGRSYNGQDDIVSIASPTVGTWYLLEGTCPNGAPASTAYGAVQINLRGTTAGAYTFDVDYVCSAEETAYVIWRFKYNAASVTGYPWEFVGGSPLIHSIVASESTTSTAATDLTTRGPLLELPRAGKYVAEISTVQYNDTAGGETNALMQINSAGAGSVSGDAGVVYRSPSANYYSSPAAVLPFIAGQHGTQVKLLYSASSGTGGTAVFLRRRLSVIPRHCS